MERLLSTHDKEYMRMAMLKHEETFKEQVCELHRLYKIQKILMKGIESRRQKGQDQGKWSSKNGISLDQIDDDCHGTAQQIRPRRKVLDLEQPADDYIVEPDENIEDESEIVLTLGPASFYRRKKGAMPLATSDSGLSFSSSSTGSNHMMKRTTSDQLSGHKWGLMDVEEERRQDRLEQSPWLFQALSLNMT